MSFTIIFYFYLAFLSSVGKSDIYAPPFHKPSLPIITVKLIFYSKKKKKETERCSSELSQGWLCKLVNKLPLGSGVASQGKEEDKQKLLVLTVSSFQLEDSCSHPLTGHLIQSSPAS